MLFCPKVNFLICLSFTFKLLNWLELYLMAMNNSHCAIKAIKRFRCNWAKYDWSGVCCNKEYGYALQFFGCSAKKGSL